MTRSNSLDIEQFRQRSDSVDFIHCSPYFLLFRLTLMFVTLLAINSQLLATAQTYQPQSLPVTTLALGKIFVRAEVAANETDREQGLMFREHLGQNEGMLFVFAETARHCFWMKNTKIPLSIAFIDEQGMITDIDEMQAATTTHHCPTRAGRYALEMNSGWFSSQGIQPGAFIGGLPH